MTQTTIATKSPTWASLFATVGLSIRPQQEVLGNAIISCFDNKENLVAESLVGTGKSYAALIPMIQKILDAKKQNKAYRGVISTETIGLQQQYVNKDLPFLESKFPGFKYMALKGRGNYLCMNHVKQNARGNTWVASTERKLDGMRGRIQEGDRSELEKLLGQEITDHEWSFLAGESVRCAEGKCKPEDCWSTKARARALASDLVVVNHAILRVDADTRDGAGDFAGETFLGPIDALVVDEAHTLANVLVDGWTEELSEWEVLQKGGAIVTGVDLCASLGLKDDGGLGRRASDAGDGIADYLKSVVKFFGHLHEDTIKYQGWGSIEDVICLKYISGSSASPGLRVSLEEYEELGVKRIEQAIDTYTEVFEYLKECVKNYDDMGIKKGRRKITKARTAAKDLLSILGKIHEAMQSTQGTVVEFGTPYVVVASGYERRNGERSVRLKIIPLDISVRAAEIWKTRSCVLMSGTMRDLTDGTFKYVVKSLGFPDHREIFTDSPFDHSTQQLVYVTNAKKNPLQLPGAQFSLEEMEDLIRAADGRSLVLFTSNKELEAAVAHFRGLAASGDFPWRVLAQEKGTNKQKLADDFRSDKHAVLFASKSFFTGNDFVGETLSLVILAKFPLPRYDAVCKEQIKWWRSKGFPRFYEMKALEVFHQAAGRLIRSATDTGVVALLDQRAMDASTSVYKTARLGVEGLGSPVVQSIEEVRKCLSVKSVV